jgi:hypothetical protein
MAIDIIFTITIMVLMPWGSVQSFDVHVVDGSPKEACNYDVACAFLDSRDIYLDIHKFKERDHCGRNILEHELAHFKYPSIDVHKVCKK